MIRIPWVTKVTNNNCLEIANECRTFYTAITKKQPSCFVHIMRITGEHCDNGKIELPEKTGTVEETEVDREKLCYMV